MSAWLTTEEHIDLLLTAAQVYSERQPDGAFTWDGSFADAADEENNPYVGPRVITTTTSDDELTRIGQQLLWTNHYALHCRYGRVLPSDVKYTFCEYPGVQRAADVADVRLPQIVDTAANSLKYQCSEFDAFRDTDTCHFVNAVIEAAGLPEPCEPGNPLSVAAWRITEGTLLWDYVPDTALMGLALHGRGTVRAAVAAHSSCPVDMLVMLAKNDTDPHVLQAVSRNPNTPSQFAALAALQVSHQHQSL